MVDQDSFVLERVKMKFKAVETFFVAANNAESAYQLKNSNFLNNISYVREPEGQKVSLTENIICVFSNGRS